MEDCISLVKSEFVFSISNGLFEVSLSLKLKNITGSVGYSGINLVHKVATNNGDYLLNELLQNRQLIL